jgi:hypothetical protein
MLSSSAKHFSQVPQPSQGNTMRRSPTFTPVACGPSFATRPTISWPIAKGSTTPRSVSDILLPPPMS